MSNPKEGDVHFPKRITDQATDPAVPTPGRKTQPQGLLQPATSAAPAPGRTTQVQEAGLKAPDPFKTGNAYADKGVACETEGTPGCFLDAPGQRQRIIHLYQLRVTAAQQQYVAALIELRIEELLKKDPEQADWLLSLFVDVISVLVSSTAKKAFQLLRGGATETIADVIGDAAKVTAEMQKASEAHFMSALGVALSAGKKQITKSTAAKSDKTEKAENVGYLDQLKMQSAHTYQHLREGTLAGVGDAGLLALFNSFDSTVGHTVNDYKEALTAQLERFKQSGITKIGLQNNPTFGAGYPAPVASLDTFMTHETKAYWVNTPMGKRLALYVRGHRSIDTPAEIQARPFQFKGYVSQELLGTALGMHLARWQIPPEEHPMGFEETIKMGSNP